MVGKMQLDFDKKLSIHFKMVFVSASSCVQSSFEREEPGSVASLSIPLPRKRASVPFSTAILSRRKLKAHP